MATVQSLSELDFDPPGPGPWSLDTLHFPRPVTSYWMEMHPEPFARGFGEVASFYGLLFKGLQYQYVNGFAYSSMRPLPDAHEDQLVVGSCDPRLIPFYSGATLLFKSTRDIR